MTLIKQQSFIDLSKTVRGILFIAPIPVFLYCIPAFYQGSDFGFLYLSSSIAFLLALYISVCVRTPLLVFIQSNTSQTESSKRINVNRVSIILCYLAAVSYIIILSSFSLYKIALVASGQATSLYTVTIGLQVSGDSSFVSRIFTAYMPSGLARGIIFALLTSSQLINFSSILKPRNLIVFSCLLTAILSILSSGGVASLVGIVQIILFVLIAPIYTILVRFFKNLKLSTKSLGVYFALVLAMAVTVYISNVYSRLKNLDGILDVIGKYFELVYNYQYVIYNYVNQAGTSGSGGLASLFPIQLEAFQSNALSLFKYHLDPVMLKGVWLGMTGRQLLEFGSEFQPLVMFFSTLTYFLILKFVANALLPSIFASRVWLFLVFSAIISCWTSDPMTGIPVAFFVVIGYTLIIKILSSGKYARGVIE